MGKILLTYCSFVIACLVVIVAFITATTYTQLAVAILLYPLLVFFAYKILPLKTRRMASKKPVTEILSSVKPAEKVEAEKRESVGISDIDKRVFLKLIGGQDFSFFSSQFLITRLEAYFPKIFLRDQEGKFLLKILPAKKLIRPKISLWMDIKFPRLMITLLPIMDLSTRTEPGL